MSKKLPFTQIHSGGEDMVDRVEIRPVDPYEMQHKINELVDAANDIIDWIKRTDETIVKYGIKPIPEKIAQGFKNPQDPYTEQLNCPEQMGYIKLDSESLAKFLKIHPQYNNNGVIEIPKKEPVDAYAEQRKWIGKVCWFWDDDNTNSSCGILTSIDTETFKEPQFVCNDEYDYEHCEPVKPDDDIIYKGGNNE